MVCCIVVQCRRKAGMFRSRILLCFLFIYFPQSHLKLPAELLPVFPTEKPPNTLGIITYQTAILTLHPMLNNICYMDGKKENLAAVLYASWVWFLAYLGQELQLIFFYCYVRFFSAS
jgi:hypothetical protein